MAQGRIGQVGRRACRPPRLKAAIPRHHTLPRTIDGAPLRSSEGHRRVPPGSRREPHCVDDPRGGWDYVKGVCAHHNQHSSALVGGWSGRERGSLLAGKRPEATATRAPADACVGCCAIAGRHPTALDSPCALERRTNAHNE
eukprot:scaffold1343_cov369-Prasinococcus_capsulatus_cf.AAC.6